MRIISYNTKGFIDWLKTNPADIICIQETKAQKEDADISEIEKLGFESYWFSAQKKGYSGVCVLTKIKPTNVVVGNGFEMSDFEGRVIRLDFGDITLFNCYFPSGTSGDERQTYKYQWLDEFMGFINDLKKTRKKLSSAVIIILLTKKLIFTTRKAIKNLVVFCPKNELGWIRF